MKRNAIIFAGLCVFALAFSMVARADDAKVAGTWEMSSQGRQGPVTQTLTVEQDGGKIKGTIKGQRGEAPFEGTVKGNAISFTVKRQTPNGEFVQEYTGTVDGDAIKGTVKMGENSRDWSAKRQK